jgi:hypothetical protein
MSLKKHSAEHPQLLTNDHAHLQFSNRPTIPRVHSLRKVTSNEPTFTPDIH